MSHLGREELMGIQTVHSERSSRFVSPLYLLSSALDNLDTNRHKEGAVYAVMACTP